MADEGETTGPQAHPPTALYQHRQLTAKTFMTQWADTKYCLAGRILLVPGVFFKEADALNNSQEQKAELFF